MPDAAPVFSLNPVRAPASLRHGGPARMVSFDGRYGLHFSSIRGRLAVPDHTVHLPQGALTMWVAPLDDVNVAPPHAHHARSNPAFDKLVLLSDREAMPEVEAANFALYYHTWWHPGFIAKWARGSYLDSCFNLRQRATAATGHFAFRRRHWYQLALTWDRETGEYKVYANGVLIAHHDTSAAKLCDDPCGPVLYMGNPSFAFSDTEFYDTVLTSEQVRTAYAASSTMPYPQLAADLAHTYEGGSLNGFGWRPGPDWETRLSLSLTDKTHFNEFFLQGCQAVSVTGEGFRFRTPDFEQSAQLGGVGSVNKFDTSVDMSRVYLWTRRQFEGDLHVSFQFKLNAEGGLALLMTQASGMQRENFLDDYALRVNGSMSTVFGEDVRNYHWEFYRQMSDTRNDLASHGLMKNPWYRPLGFQVENRRWETGRWYQLDWLQEGARLRAAIDGVTVLDACDSADDNNGSVLTAGRIALRCMMRTDLTIRDLKVRNRAHFDTLPIE